MLRRKWEVYDMAGNPVMTYFTYRSACRHAEEMNWKFFETGNWAEDYMVYRVRRRQDV